MKLSKAQLGKVLESVTEDLAALIKSEETEDQTLSKTDPGEEAPAEKTPEGSSSEGSGGDDDGDEGAPPAPEASADGGHGEPDGDEGSAPAPEASPEASADPAAETSPMSPEALEAEYAQLSPEEMKMHLLALQSAYMKVAGGAGPGAAPGPEASAPTPAAPGPEASAPVPPMGKGEMKTHAAGNGGKVSAGKMAKSEDGDVLVKMEALSTQVAELTKSLADKDATISKLEESLGQVAEGFKRILTKQGAMRKSVSGVSFVGKPGDAPAAGEVDIKAMSKAEVNEKLNAYIRSNAKTLTKSDREAIQKFVAGGASVETVAKFITVG